MKPILKRTSLLLTAVLVGGKLFAQTSDTSPVQYVKPFSGNSAYSTWSVGVNAGALSTNTLFTSKSRLDFTSPGTELGYGFYIKNQITPAVGIQADFLAGKLSGNNSQVLASTGTSLFSSFSTKIHYGGSLSANITVGNISWHANKSAIQPYLTVGFGAMNYTPVVTYAAGGKVTNFKTNSGSDGSIGEVYTPVGVGLKFDLGSGINLDLGYQVNFVYSDNVDGYNFGSGNDKFSYAHVGLEFALGSHSRPQLATHNPVSSMRHEYLSENWDTRSELQKQIDAEKAQIEAERAANAQLRSDLNATNAALARFTTDSDNDGVPDFLDKCPNTPAGTKVDGAGCPLPVNKPDVKVYVTEEDKKIVNEAVRNLEFDFNKTTIRPHSYASLDRLAQLLIDKHFNLKLAGYTDNIGSVAFNLKLSNGRAEAVKDYLVGKNADASRIQAEGYGKAHPIATNKTAKGRQLNRRVEFTLF
jgi:OOP family OmpA-OmpF porin